jgi:hypothetical protein
MKRLPRTLSALGEALRSVMPYWFVCLLGIGIDQAFSSNYVSAALLVLAGYIGLGLLLVFGMLKQSSQQNSERLDFRGAIKNAYYAAWWPWYVWRRSKHG